jgi:hypothetical protein
MKKFHIDLFDYDAGFGDTVQRAIKTITKNQDKECDKCEKRRKYLNKVIPYRNPLTKKYE